MKLVYPSIFTPLEQQEGFCVTFPDLPGCVTQGSSLTEAMEMAQDAACGWILDALEEGEQLPKPSNISSVLSPQESFTSVVVLDIDSYAEKYGNKAVRKNCTIPSWLNTLAERDAVNFSSVLQEALIKKLNLNQ